MSEKYIQIASFKYGLDARRQELVSQPGVLVTCENAHINSGGEIEKRKAFVLDGTPFPANTFGLQDTDEGLMTFGSDAAASGALPTGVSYQRLLPTFLSVLQPRQTVAGAGTAAVNGVYNQAGVSNGKPYYVLSGSTSIVWESGLWIILSGGTGQYTSSQNVATPDLVTVWTAVNGTLPVPTVTFSPTTLAQMTKVVFSSNYLGKAFVIAQFGDALTGTHIFTFCFYDGELVDATRNGLVLLGSGGAVETISELAQDLADQVNAISGWSASANVDENGVAFAGSVIVKSPAGVHFSPVPSFSSTLGQLGAILIDQNPPGTSGVAAIATFEITAGGALDTITVTAPKNHPDDLAVAELTGGAISYITSLTVTAAAVVTAINARTFITGYSASSNAARVQVTAPLAFGADTDNLTVVTTGTMVVGPVGSITGAFSIVLTPATINSNQTGTFPSKLVQASVTASTANAVGAVSVTLTTTTASFIIPAIGATVAMTVASGANIVDGDYITLTSGFSSVVVLKVSAGGGTGNLTLLNDGFRGSSGSVVPNGATVARRIDWTECNSDGTYPVTVASGILMVNKVGGTNTFQANLSTGNNLQGYFLVLIQSADATPTSATKVLSVSLSYQQV